jgi:multiple sugar transport system permease protein
MALLFIPWVLSPTVASIIWRWLFNPAIGLIEMTLRELGLVGIGGTLANPNGAMAIMIGLSVWQGLPFSMLLLLAGLQSISTELIEASRLDGASAWQVFRYITLPLLRPQLLVLLLLLTIGAVNASDAFIVVTDGGPGNATEVLGIRMYHMAFRFFQLTQGSALAVIMFFINLAIAVIYFRVFSAQYEI